MDMRKTTAEILADLMETLTRHHADLLALRVECGHHDKDRLAAKAEGVALAIEDVRRLQADQIPWGPGSATPDLQTVRLAPGDVVEMSKE